MCKHKYALIVNSKMSLCSILELCNAACVPGQCAYALVIPALCRQKRLDVHPNVDIIIFTAGHGGSSAAQTIIAAPARHAESSARRGPARELSQQRLFRSRGSAAGQVRDAASGGRRQAAGQPGSQSLRFLAPSFYQAQAAFQEAGLAGLLPQKRGPRSGHKLTGEPMQFVTQLRAAEPEISTSQLAKRVTQRFGVSVHPRSIDRQLQRQKNSGEFGIHLALFYRSPISCRLRRAPLSSSTRVARTGYGTDDIPWIPLLDGSLEPTSRE
jgi:Homeodomain-like domain